MLYLDNGCFISVLKIENLDPRGIQLSALFMSGVDMALFANDACGQPIPWEHCCPWMYFDGKLFQTKLIKASREKVPLIDLCDGQVGYSSIFMSIGSIAMFREISPLKTLLKKKYLSQGT